MGFCIVYDVLSVLMTNGNSYIFLKLTDSLSACAALMAIFLPLVLHKEIVKQSVRLGSAANCLGDYVLLRSTGTMVSADDLTLPAGTGASADT